MKNKALLFFLFGSILFLWMNTNSFEVFFNEYIYLSFLSNYVKLILATLLFFPVFLFFSVLTYKAPEKVFIAWWKFARYTIPLVLISSIFVSLGALHTLGGFLNFDDLVDISSFSLIGLLFSLGSIIQIIRGYRQK